LNSAKFSRTAGGAGARADQEIEEYLRGKPAELLALAKKRSFERGVCGAGGAARDKHRTLNAQHRTSNQ